MELVLKGYKMVVLIIRGHERVSFVSNNPIIDHVDHCQVETCMNLGVQSVFFQMDGSRSFEDNLEDIANYAQDMYHEKRLSGYECVRKKLSNPINLKCRTITR